MTSRDGACAVRTKVEVELFIGEAEQVKVRRVGVRRPAHGRVRLAGEDVEEVRDGVNEEVDGAGALQAHALVVVLAHTWSAQKTHISFSDIHAHITLPTIPTYCICRK